MRTLLCFGLLLLLAGCKETIDVVLPGDRPLAMVVYRNGTLTQRCDIASYSPQFKQLQEFLSANRDGWVATSSTVAPVTLVTGKGLSINFLRDSVVVSSENGQFQRSIPSSEYAFLRCPE